MSDLKILCCTMYSPSHHEMAKLCVPNMTEYCERHGYILGEILIENDRFAYKKHEYFKKMMSSTDVDIIFYCDVDSLITNHSVPVENFLEDGYSFYITKDFNELNGGAVIIRADKGGKLLNDVILDNRGDFENEQNIYNSPAFADFMGDIIKVVPHPSFNSYDYSLYPECKDYRGVEELGDWQKGNFLIHFPGLGVNDKIEMMKEYSNLIIK